jgi:hypothetical protein
VVAALRCTRFKVLRVCPDTTFVQPRARALPLGEMSLNTSTRVPLKSFRNRFHAIPRGCALYAQTYFRPAPAPVAVGLDDPIDSMIPQRCDPILCPTGNDHHDRWE